MRSFRIVMTALAMLAALPVAADAQVIGTFTWQTRPYCNLVTMTISQVGGVYHLSGSDNLCGAGVAPISGTAVPAGSSVALGFSVHLPTGRTAQVTATLDLTTVSGTWRDADASTGPFTSTNISNGGAPRPAPASAASITVSQLGPTIYGGTGTAGTVARSDHDHDARYAPRTTTVSLSGHAMSFIGDGALGTVNGCATNYTTVATGHLVLPLPVGATLNAVSLDAFDTSGSAAYTVSLRRQIVGPSSMSTSSIGSATGGALSLQVVRHDLAVPAGTVVDSTSALIVTFNSATAFSNGLCRVLFTYTVPAAE